MMNMETLQFKTNINCGGCVAKVTPYLNKETDIKHWKVDTTNPQKVLTVETVDLNAKNVIAILNRAGFKAEEIA